VSAAHDYWLEQAELEDEQRFAEQQRRLYPGTPGPSDRCLDCTSANHVHLRTHHGFTRCLTHWAKVLGVSPQAMHQRVKSGLVGDALFAPKGPRAASLRKMYPKRGAGQLGAEGR
jgi:hypothetical protein